MQRITLSAYAELMYYKSRSFTLNLLRMGREIFVTDYKSSNSRDWKIWEYFYSSSGFLTNILYLRCVVKFYPVLFVSSSLRPLVTIQSQHGRGISSAHKSYSQSCTSVQHLIVNTQSDFYESVIIVSLVNNWCDFWK